MIELDNLFMPYENGSPVGIRKYGTGILVDDIKIQYQLSGGDDYFFSFGLGLAHRTKNLNVYLKLIGELTTDTVASKYLTGISYGF